MNEENNKMSPYTHLFRALEKELGYDPCEGCENFQEVLHNLSKNENLTIKPSTNQGQQITIHLHDNKQLKNEGDLSKEILFSDNPKQSVVVHDKITQKKKTYIPPLPKINKKELDISIKDILSRRKQAKQSRNDKND